MGKMATFFGAARTDEASKEYSDSVYIGNILAECGYKVYNGGYGGLMKAVSLGASAVGAEVEGFTCPTFGFTKGNPYLTKYTVAPDIYHRLRMLISSSDVFIVQVGGIGTLAELCLTLDECRRRKKKPLICLIGNHWQWFLDCPLIQDNVKEMVTVVTDVNQLHLLL